jgi:hypothetical protein
VGHQLRRDPLSLIAAVPAFREQNAFQFEVDAGRLGVAQPRAGKPRKSHHINVA